MFEYDLVVVVKAHLVKAMVFSVVTYGCESWTIKNGEQRVPRTARRSN